MTTRRNLVRTIGGMGVIGMLAGCTDNADEIDTVEIQDTEIYDEPLTGFGFSGVAVNVTDSTVPNVAVEVTVFEGQDVPIQVDTVTEEIGDMQPGQREEFAIGYEQDEYREENLSIEAAAIQTE
jgi:hypothetical protein